MKLLCTILAFLLISPGFSQLKPWENFKLDSKKQITLNLKNVSIITISEVIMKESGITIICDPSLNQTLTLYTPKPISLDKVFSLFNSELEINNLEMDDENNILVIRAKQKEQRDKTDRISDKLVLESYQIKWASADNISKIINDVFNGTQSQTPIIVVPTNIQTSPTADSVQPVKTLVKVSVESYSNSIIVRATESNQFQIKALIAQLDKNTTIIPSVKVVKLVYANAINISNILQNVISALIPKNNTDGQSSINIFADPRTNSLIIVSSDKNIQLTNQVIAFIDNPIEIKNDILVSAIKNSDSVKIANLFTSAYGK